MRPILPTLTALSVACAEASPSAGHHHKRADSRPNIVETAAAAGGFEILLAAVEAAGVADTLQGDGPFTLFAPTDEAFAALPEGTLDSLLEPGNRDALAAILTYHVVADEVPASRVGSLRSATTVNGQRLDVRLEAGRVRVGEASVGADR